jgi:hypothetical protein
MTVFAALHESGYGTFETYRPTLRMSVYRGETGLVTDGFNLTLQA